MSRFVTPTLHPWVQFSPAIGSTVAVLRARDTAARRVATNMKHKSMLSWWRLSSETKLFVTQFKMSQHIPSNGTPSFVGDATPTATNPWKTNMAFARSLSDAEQRREEQQTHQKAKHRQNLPSSEPFQGHRILHRSSISHRPLSLWITQDHKQAKSKIAFPAER